MTIAEQLNIKEFPFIIKDKNGRTTYCETRGRSWERHEYDSNGNITYYENSNKYWHIKQYDSNGKEIYYENSNKYWVRYEYDSNGDITYYEDSNGKKYGPSKAPIVELTLEDIAKLKGVPVNQIRIKD